MQCTTMDMAVGTRDKCLSRRNIPYTLKTDRTGRAAGSKIMTQEHGTPTMHPCALRQSHWGLSSTHAPMLRGWPPSELANSFSPVACVVKRRVPDLDNMSNRCSGKNLGVGLQLASLCEKRVLRNILRSIGGFSQYPFPQTSDNLVRLGNVSLPNWVFLAHLLNNRASSVSSSAFRGVSLMSFDRMNTVYLQQIPAKRPYQITCRQLRQLGPTTGLPALLQDFGIWSAGPLEALTADTRPSKTLGAFPAVASTTSSWRRRLRAYA